MHPHVLTSRSLGFSLVLLLVSAAWSLATETNSDSLRVYIGTYTGKNGSQGIYRSTLDLKTGQLSPPVLAGEAINPSFLAIHPSRRFLYAVSEVDDAQGRKTGSVRSFAIDSASGDLQPLNNQSTGGPGLCHISVDRAGKNVLVASYGGGNVAVLPIREDGRLGPPTSFVQHHGSSVDRARQAGPHAHSINLDAANRFAFVADLGLDKVMIYRFDPAAGTLTANDPPSGSVAPGSGPRHFAFHPDGRHAYVINELASTVTGFDYDPATGKLSETQTLSTLPAPTRGNSTAEVQVHPSGKFLYGSNRGHNSIAVFSIDPASGKLTATGHQGEGIKVPRNFGIDPTGQYLVVANQDGKSLIVFRIDPQSGQLTPTGSKIEVSKPVCVKFVRAD